MYSKKQKLAGLSQNMIILISKLHRQTKTAKEKAEMMIQVKISKFGVFQIAGFLSASVKKLNCATRAWSQICTLWRSCRLISKLC